MNEELKIIIKAVTDSAKKSIRGVREELEKAKKSGEQSGKAVDTAMRVMNKSALLAIGAISSLTTALVMLGKRSMEYQKLQARLNAGFQSMGLSAQQAASTYGELFSFLGERDTATEAANLLAQLTQNEEDLAEWTNILMGVYAKFPSSLPVESLAEAANETAKTGKVTGALADALNWAGASEEAFQAQLESLNSTAEREAFIRNTLNNLYSGSASLYKQNNKALIEYNKSQVDLDNALAEAAKYVTPLMTSLNSLGATLLTYLSPAIHTVSIYLTAFIQLLGEAVEWVATFFGVISGSASSVPGADIAGYQKAMEDYMAAVNGASDGTEQYRKEMEKAKKQAMGFDELNIVSKQTTTSANTGSSPGASNIKAPNAADFGMGADAMLARQEEYNKRLEAAKKVLKPIMITVAAIASAIRLWKLGGWIADLVQSIKLLSKYKTLEMVVQTTASTAIPAMIGKVAAFGKVFSKIGTIAVKVWGSIKPVLTAIGGAFKAILPVLGKVVTAIGGFFAKIGSWIAAAAKAVAGFVSGVAGTITGGMLAAIIAIIVAVISAIVFLVRNWDELGQSVKNFFAENIAPKFEKIKETLGQLWDAIKSVGKAFADLGIALWNAIKLLGQVFADLGIMIWNAIPEGVKEWFRDVAAAIVSAFEAVIAWFGNVGKAIANAFKAVIDWIKNINWAAIWNGFVTVIEWIGGFVVGILGGVIGGAINAVIGAIQGVVQFITGVVQVISGIVTGLVYLIVGLFTGDFTKVLDSVKMIWDGVVNVFKGLYNVTIGLVVNLVKGIIDWFVEMWDVLVGHSIIPDTVEAIIDWFLQLPKQLFSMISNFVKTIIDFFKDMAAKAGDTFKNMVENIKKPFANIASWFKDTFTKAWQGVKDVFNKGGVIFDGIKSGISNVFTTIVNGLITGINAVIAVPFNTINGILNGIRNISVAGVTPFSGLWKQNPLAVPQIPKLATGGLVDGATLAMIGERGKEAVLPLENNTEWMDALADRIAARNSTPTKVVLQVGEKELGYATIKSINGITRQTGTLQLVMP